MDREAFVRKTFATLVGVLLVAGSSRAEQPVGLDQIAPSLSQLGPGWTSNHVVVLVDQLSPSNEICNEGKGWLQAAHNVVGKRGCQAQAVFRYQCGSIGVLVWVNRYRSMKDIGEDWGRDKDTKESPGGLPQVGEEVRFYQRHGMHNNIAFRRGSYLVDIESPSAPIEKLKQLAEAFDSNLVKAQKAAGVSQPRADLSSQTASTQFVAEGSVDYYNFWAVEVLKTHPEFKPVVSNTMKFSVVVSNSCYLMRLEPTREIAARYHEAGFDGKTLYLLSALNLSGPQNGPGVRGGSNVATGWVYGHQRMVYSLFAHEMGPVWLMFASGDYLRSVTNGLIEPPLTIGLFENDDYFPRPFTIPAQWTVQEAFPYLPLRVTCRDDGEVKTGPPFQDAKREPPFDAGFTNIVFRVTGTRECDGIRVPSSAELDTYRPEPHGKPELLHYTRYRLTLKKWARNMPPTCFMPSLPGPTTISDTRTAGAGSSRSMLATKWPSEEEVSKGEHK